MDELKKMNMEEYKRRERERAIRDKFAAYAIACGAWAPVDTAHPKEVAKIAYDLADEMMAERERRAW